MLSVLLFIKKIKEIHDYAILNTVIFILDRIGDAPVPGLNVANMGWGVKTPSSVKRGKLLLTRPLHNLVLTCKFWAYVIPSAPTTGWASM